MRKFTIKVKLKIFPFNCFLLQKVAFGILILIVFCLFKEIIF
jgi:hypothetical protein